jgi:hypothetical protein
MDTVCSGLSSASSSSPISSWLKMATGVREYTVHAPAPATKIPHPSPCRHPLRVANLACALHPHHVPAGHARVPTSQGFVGCEEMGPVGSWRKWEVAG